MGPGLLRRLSSWWAPIGRALGHAQAQVLLALIYFVAVVPFALVARLVRGRFGSGPFAPGGFWSSRPGEDHSLDAARRQF